MELAVQDIILLSIVGLITGFAKFSVGGMGMLVLPLIMLLVPGPEALGVLVPMFIVTDVMAVALYRKSISWSVLARFLPIQLIGLAIGGWIIADISLSAFSWLIAGAIISMLALSWWLDHHDADFMRHPVMTTFSGFASGVLSMAASAGGPFASLYMLEQKLSKESYVSTRACSFLLVDIAKVPILLTLGYINWDTTQMGMQALPAVLLGACIGYWLLKKLALSQFKWVIRGIAFIAAVKLIFPI